MHSLKNDAAGVAAGAGLGIHAFTQPLGNARAPTVPVVAESPRAMLGIRTANCRTAVHQTARESPTPVPGGFLGRRRSMPTVADRSAGQRRASARCVSRVIHSPHARDLDS